VNRSLRAMCLQHDPSSSVPLAGVDVNSRNPALDRRLRWSCKAGCGIRGGGVSQTRNGRAAGGHSRVR
jgi:hypothetical protein